MSEATAWAARGCLVTLALLLGGCSLTLQQPGGGEPPQETIARPVPPPPEYPSCEMKPLGISVIHGTSVVGSLKAPSDLWERIRSGFSMPDLETELVQKREAWYDERPDLLLKVADRSEKYMFHIVEELEVREMPSELALLPYVESAFNPQATSRARAAGMWQFMPKTGDSFQLRQNAFQDDRRDVIASTRAALDYLQYLYNRFGDWHLALAAYNWGEGNVNRAIRKNVEKGLPADYASLKMPEETRQYVPRLQALKNIVADPDRYRLELPLTGNHPYFQEVEIHNDIDIELVARLADVSQDEFRALNPSFNRPVILAATTPSILLPWDNAEIFKRNLAAHKEGQYASWTAWRLPRTMNAAQAAREVGMSESILCSINDIPPRMLIKAGSTLIVPRTARIQNDVTAEVAGNGKVELTPEAGSARSGGGRRILAPARKRETVRAIAKRFNVSASDVAAWNKVKIDAHFNAGHKVLIILPGEAAQKKAPAQKQGRKTASVAKVVKK